MLCPYSFEVATITERCVHPAHAIAPAFVVILNWSPLAETREQETGKAPALNVDFAADTEEILEKRKPWNPPAWARSLIPAASSLRAPHPCGFCKGGGIFGFFASKFSVQAGSNSYPLKIAKGGVPALNPLIPIASGDFQSGQARLRPRL